MQLQGKTAVVTGAASGIGRATAEKFAAAGAHVLLGDIATEAGEAVAARAREKGQRADFIRLDVTDPASIEAFRRDHPEAHDRASRRIWARSPRPIESDERKRPASGRNWIAEHKHPDR